MHALSDGFDFTYGSDNGDGSFHMMSGSHAGQDLTVSQIQADYAGYEAYGWVGVTGDGTTSVSGHIGFDRRQPGVRRRDRRLHDRIGSLAVSRWHARGGLSPPLGVQDPRARLFLTLDDQNKAIPAYSSSRGAACRTPPGRINSSSSQSETTKLAFSVKDSPGQRPLT